MTKKASNVIKNIISLISSITRSKILGFKSKADAMRARLMVFSLMKNERPSLSSITHKIHTLLERKPDKDDESPAIVIYNTGNEYEEEDESKYPDLTHSLFDEELEVLQEQHPGGTIVDMMKSSKEHKGQDFVLEDEIDHVADLFIRKFRKQMRLQKLESFKRYQEMLERSA